MFNIDRLKPARVVRVHNANRIEFDLDLGFGVHIHRVFSLQGFDQKQVPEAHRQAAVHAVVVLIGGKSVFVEPENDRADCREARVYLNERIHGTPIGFVSNIPRLARPILDVSMFMAWLSDHAFDIKLVHAVINGQKHPVMEGG